jgi:hypothetical protein
MFAGEMSADSILLTNDTANIDDMPIFLSAFFAEICFRTKKDAAGYFSVIPRIRES